MHYRFGMDSKMEQATREVPNDLIERVQVGHDAFGREVLLFVWY